jgi:uncharacterized protein YndB with AHSA1/START domain
MASVRILDELIVRAPISDVWAAIKNPAAHVAWHPFLTGIEGEHALGATRACSVTVGGKQGTTRERCIEEEQERRISWAIEEDSTGFSHMVSDWRAGFSLEPAGPATRVVAESVFRPRSVLIRIMSPIVRRKFHHTQRAILVGLKNACEQTAS